MYSVAQVSFASTRQLIGPFSDRKNQEKNLRRQLWIHREQFSRALSALRRDSHKITPDAKWLSGNKLNVMNTDPEWLALICSYRIADCERDLRALWRRPLTTTKVSFNLQNAISRAKEIGSKARRKFHSLST